MVADFRFEQKNGKQLECAVTKITPYIGTAASTAFTFVPVGIMALVGAASWQSHVSELGASSLVQYGSTMASQGPVWETVTDLLEYIQYLQFVFLSSSLVMTYPGFYEPIVSKLAWASLLYWSSPVNHGHTWQGLDEGMYTSNASFGIEHMVQILEFPVMARGIFDAFIDLLIMAAGLFVTLLVLYCAKLRPIQGASIRSIAQTVGGITVVVTSLFFSGPLLFYLSHELPYIGYLPDFNIALVILMMFVVVIAACVFAHRCEHQRQRTLSEDLPPSFYPRQLLRYLYQWLPMSIPLVQAIGVGGLFPYGLAQLFMLVGSEAVLLIHRVTHQKVCFLRSQAVWCSAIRLLALSLTFTFISPASEVTRQYVGYTLLCLHGAVIFPGFFFSATWRLYRAFQRKKKHTQDVSMHSGGSDSSVAPGLPLDSLSAHFIQTNTKYQRNDAERTPQHSFDRLRTFHRPGLSGAASFGTLSDMSTSGHASHAPSATPVDAAHFMQDYSVFYRKPRSRNMTPTSGAESVSRTPDMTEGGSSLCTPSEGPSSDLQFAQHYPSDDLQELRDVLIRPGVDYSVRESDLFYGKPVHNEWPPMTSSPSEDLEEGQSSRRSFYGNWTRNFPTSVKRPKKEKEKGFQVARPPRPPST
ncbi:hypothetical protein QQS21_010737 [Conoideocrella luteorostrata]|uniref:TRP C-terminal domain-containing protein n=1 Tax=Conoideocrella luteorostrata TaxID=1105319 RepID=A0AAJ0FP58_9HYPO|nr:hypothetical protein QQS21_010737 [Conoideocrella luteorostrata]